MLERATEALRVGVCGAISKKSSLICLMVCRTKKKRGTGGERRSERALSVTEREQPLCPDERIRYGGFIRLNVTNGNAGETELEGGYTRNNCFVSRRVWKEERETKKAGIECRVGARR